MGPPPCLACQYQFSCNKQNRWRVTAASLTQCGLVAWWSQVAGSGPWCYQWPAFLRAVSAVGLSGKGCCPAAHASETPGHGCTPARGPPPHSGAPGNPSGTRRYVAGCRSRGSGRGAGSRLKREHRWISSFQQVILERFALSCIKNQ